MNIIIKQRVKILNSLMTTILWNHYKIIKTCFHSRQLHQSFIIRCCHRMTTFPDINLFIIFLSLTFLSFILIQQIVSISGRSGQVVLGLGFSIESELSKERTNTDIVLFQHIDHCCKSLWRESFEAESNQFLFIILRHIYWVSPNIVLPYFDLESRQHFLCYSIWQHISKFSFF
jgi:hypothetical protein